MDKDTLDTLIVELEKKFGPSDYKKSWKHCKLCNHLLERYEVGTYKNPKNKKFADVHGNLWNGHTCPDCHRNKIKEGMRVLRASKV